MRLRIDFSGRRPRPRVSSVLLLGITCAALIAAAGEYSVAHTEQQAVVEALANIRALGTRKAVQISPKQIEAMNRTVRQLNLPWQPLLSAIEEHLSERVSLLSLEPDASVRIIHLQVEARSADDMLDFVEALDSDNRFVAATLKRHEINESDHNRPYRFILEAEWSADL